MATLMFDRPSIDITPCFLILQEFHTLKRCDSSKVRSSGNFSRCRKKRRVSSRETPVQSRGNLFVDVNKRTLSNSDKRDGNFAVSSHNPKEDSPDLSANKRWLFLSFLFLYKTLPFLFGNPAK